MVTNDSEPGGNSAAAAGAAVIEISCHPSSGDPLHYNSPVRFRPWVEKYAVLQPRPVEFCSSACEWHEAHCILGVSVEAAREAARTLIADPQSTPDCKPVVMSDRGLVGSVAQRSDK